MKIKKNTITNKEFIEICHIVAYKLGCKCGLPYEYNIWHFSKNGPYLQMKYRGETLTVHKKDLGIEPQQQLVDKLKNMAFRFVGIEDNE